MNKFVVFETTYLYLCPPSQYNAGLMVTVLPVFPRSSIFSTGIKIIQLEVEKHKTLMFK